MNTHATPTLLAENLWLLAYPLKMLGADLRRNVTLIRLRSGKLVIHSTAAFSPEDVAAFRRSLATILGRDSDRVIVGHGEVIEHEGNAKLRTALEAAGFSL